MNTKNKLNKNNGGFGLCLVIMSLHLKEALLLYHLTPRGGRMARRRPSQWRSPLSGLAPTALRLTVHRWKLHEPRRLPFALQTRCSVSAVDISVPTTLSRSLTAHSWNGDGSRTGFHLRLAVRWLPGRKTLSYCKLM